ncbi:autotransporter domain-containing protein [Ahniella affigens]|nr:autotransporter domain-containing protein [Ahniella affigens]
MSPKFAQICTVLLSFFVSGPTVALVCPPPAASPTTINVVEGQVPEIRVAETNTILSVAPPDVNAHFVLVGSPTTVGFFGSGATDTTFPVAWTAVVPTGFEYSAAVGVATRPGSAAGSPYTVHVTGEDPSGCGPTPTPTVFTVNVGLPTSPAFSFLQGGTQAPVNPGQTFGVPIILETRANAAPLANVQVLATVVSGSAMIRPAGTPVGSGTTSFVLLTNAVGQVAYEVDAGLTAGPVSIEFQTPDFAGVSIQTASLQVNGVAPTITCPPPAFLTPPGSGWVEGQVVDFQIGESIATGTAPPNVNAAWRIDGNPSTLYFAQSGTNQIDQSEPWVLTSPGIFSYSSLASLKLKTGSAGSTYTIRAYANDPNGCGTFTADRTFNITVSPPVSPTLSLQSAPPPTNPNTTFPGTLQVLVTNNGSPLESAVVRFFVASGDVSLSAGLPPTMDLPGGRPPPTTELFVLTNPFGVAEVSVQALSTPGAVVIQASSPDLMPSASPTNINLTILGGTVDTFTASPPDANTAPYSATSGTEIATFQVTAQRDPGSGPAPFPGVPVRFSVAGDATLLDSGGASHGTSFVVTSDSLGVAQIRVLAGAAGSPYNMTASVDSGSFTASPVTWLLQNLPEPTFGSVAIVSGDNQVGEPGAALQDLVVDVTLSSVRVPSGSINYTFTVASGDVAFLDPGPVNTYTLSFPFLSNGTFRHSIPLVAGSGEGPYHIVGDGFGLNKIEFNGNVVRAIPLVVQKVSGDHQSAQVGNQLPAPLVAGLPGGITFNPQDQFTFRVVSGDITLSGANGNGRELSLSPDGNNQAQVHVNLGQAAGPAEVEVSFPGLNAESFSMEATANPSALVITKVSGDNQSAPLNTRLSAPLVVQAPGPGVVTWRVASGNAALLGASNGLLSTTLSNNSAQAQVLLGNSIGPVEIEVAGQGFQAIRFRANSVAPLSNYRIEKVSGDQQTLRLNTPSAPLKIRVTDNGQALSGFNVSWNVLGQGSLGHSVTQTNSNGESENVFVPLSAGPAYIRATVTNPTNNVPVSADFFVNTPVAILALVSGGGQSGAPGTEADADLVFQLTQDSFAIASSEVSFSVVGNATLSTTSGLTDGDGKARTRVRYGSSPGSVLVTASALQGAVTATAVATVFAPGLNIVSGNNQSGRPGQALADPLVLQISQPVGGSAFAKSLAGVPVHWDVTCGNGTVQTAATATDAQGKSSNRLTLGTTPGCNRVEATVAGVGKVVFEATGLIPATALEIVSGDPQNALVPGEASAPLVVRVRDANNQPVDNVRIVFEAVSNGVTVTPAEQATNAQGQAQTVARLGLPGQFQVRAKAPDFSSIQPVLFTLTASLRNLDNLPPGLRDVAGTIDTACVALSQLTNLSPAQQDLLQRCSEVVTNAANRPGDASNALSEMKIEDPGSQNQLLLAAAEAQNNNLGQRMTALRSGNAGGFQNNLALITNSGALQLGYLPSTILGLNAADEPQAGAGFSRWGFFATGSIGRGRRSALDDDPGFDFKTYGLTAGVDYRVTDSIVLGAALGFNRNDSDVRGNQASVNNRGTTLSAYGSWYHPANFYVDGVLTFGRHQLDLSRDIRYTLQGLNGNPITIQQTATASPDSDQFGISLAFGRDWNRGAWAFGPYTRFNYTKIDFDAYTEEMSNPNAPGAGLALSVDSRGLTSLEGILGGKLSYTASTSWGVLMPYASLEWVKQFEDQQDDIVTRFAFDPTRTAILSNSDLIDSDYLNLGLGLSGVFANGKSAFLQYERTIGQDRSSSDSLAIGVRIEF